MLLRKRGCGGVEVKKNAKVFYSKFYRILLFYKLCKNLILMKIKTKFGDKRIMVYPFLKSRWENREWSKTGPVQFTQGLRTQNTVMEKSERLWVGELILHVT